MSYPGGENVKIGFPVSKTLADERMLEPKLQQPFTPRSRTIELLVTDFRMPRWVLTAPPAQQGFTIASIEKGFNGKPGPRPLVVPAHPSLWLLGFALLAAVNPKCNKSFLEWFPK